MNIINQSITKKEENKQVFLKVEYDRNYKNFKHAIESLRDESNAALIKVISVTKKVANFTSTYCPTSKNCKSNLVYQFDCQGCDSR